MKNQSNEGINKNTGLLEFYIHVTFRDVQVTRTLKKSVTEFEHWTLVIPTTYLLLPGSIFDLFSWLYAGKFARCCSLFAYKSLSPTRS